MSELITKTYLQNQFVSYSNAIKNNFAEKKYTNTEAPTVSTVEEALDILFANGGGILEEDLTATADFGGIENGTIYTKGTELEKILRDLLNPYSPCTVSLILTPSTTLYDIVEDSLSSITLNIITTKKTKDIVSVKVYANDTLIHTVTEDVTNGGTFTYKYTPATPINTTTIFKIVANDGVQDTTVSKTVAFVGKTYYGYVDPTIGEPTEALIKTLNTTLKNSKGYVYEGIICDYNKVVYCYPSSFGNLTSIMDKVNNFNYTTSFAKTTVTVDGIEYNCYTQIDPSAANDLDLTFA